MPRREGRIAGILLAAGSSTRLGRNKLYVELGGETLLRRAALGVVEAGCDPVLVVLGPEPDRARDELDGTGCVAIENPDHAEGRRRSLEVGLAEVPDDAIAAVVILADMPLVTPDMLAAIVERYRAGSEPLVVSRYGDVQAPPMLYDRSLFGELATMTGKGCGRQVVRRHEDEAATMDWSAERLQDVDRPEDLERVRARLAGS